MSNGLCIFYIQNKMFGCSAEYFYNRVGNPNKYFELTGFENLKDAKKYLESIGYDNVIIETYK